MSARPKRYRGFAIREEGGWYVVETLASAYWPSGRPVQVCISWDHACRVIDAMKGD